MAVRKPCNCDTIATTVYWLLIAECTHLAAPCSNTALLVLHLQPELWVSQHLFNGMLSSFAYSRRLQSVADMLSRRHMPVG